MNGIAEGVRLLRGTSVNQVPDVEHVLVTAGTGVSDLGPDPWLTRRSQTVASNVPDQPVRFRRSLLSRQRVVSRIPPKIEATAFSHSLARCP
jgi:hypothetical protein